jgi:hypothetical protein
MRTHLHRALAALILILGLAVFAPTGATAVGVGKMCGGIAGIPCDSGLWCEPRAGKCGVADIDGKCVKVPTVCNKIFRPVCGCDNKTYGNDCDRLAAKVQKNHNGRCKY